MTHFRTIALLALLLLGISAPACTADTEPTPDPKTQLQNLSGTYTSTAAEDWGNGTYGFRTFSFDKGKWTLSFVLALDPGLQNKVFEFRTFGTYQVLDASTVVPTAFNALFLEEKKFVTLRAGDANLVQAFGLAGCGLTKDVEKDISTDGCAIWAPVSVCNQDHDLLSLDAEGRLYFGQRPLDNNMCTADRRPTALLPAVVKK